MRLIKLKDDIKAGCAVDTQESRGTSWRDGKILGNKDDLVISKIFWVIRELGQFDGLCDFASFQPQKTGLQKNHL